MALYLGDKKVKINMDGIVCFLNLISDEHFLNKLMLFSHDNYMLKDANGIYLTVKESE